jgi:5-methylcytosine-specific restriction enzyme A
LVENGKLNKPPGSATPARRLQTVAAFARNVEVVAWVLQQAQGVCEACKVAAPFSLPSGRPYLEVHHVLRLADGGPDVVENAIALCPNCHRRLHYAADAENYRCRMIASVERLVDFKNIG